MHNDKAQKFILAEIVKSPRFAKKTVLDDGRIFVTPNSEVGFIFNRQELMLDLSGVEELGNRYWYEEIADFACNLIKRTKTIIDADGSSSGYLTVFRKAGKPIYVKTKYLKYFGACAEFYQKSEYGPVVVKENDEIKGMIMPSRYEAEELYEIEST